MLFYFPFFYFQQTRLNNLKAWLFHSAYEWVPALLACVYFNGFNANLLNLFLCYLSFICLYEIGYIANDQLAHNEKDGRARSEKFSALSIVLFILLRCLIFISATYYLRFLHFPLWWWWYGLLALAFALHNLIKSHSLKVITFSYLALVRFFSPFIFLIPLDGVKEMALPVFVNYVLFRLFIYMDSKKLLSSFERKSINYQVGFYLLTLPLSIMLSLIYESWVPVGFNGYFLILALFVTLTSLNKSPNLG